MDTLRQLTPDHSKHGVWAVMRDGRCVAMLTRKNQHGWAWKYQRNALYPLTIRVGTASYLNPTYVLDALPIHLWDAQVESMYGIPTPKQEAA